jgi:pimeloyl-ACP methyl ester carboxylesterase
MWLVIPTPGTETLTASERRTRLAGIRTRELSLEGEGPPLLLLHGYADSADTWAPLLERLARTGRAATAIDLGGFGAAQPLPATGPLLPQWDRMVDAAIERLGTAGEPIVVGNSLGGCLAMRAAERHRNALAGIVPIAPAGLEMARWFTIIESERLLRLIRHSPLPVPAPLVREVVGRVYAGLAFSSAAVADRTAISSFTRHISSVARATEILATGRRLLPELTDPFQLELIECPLLLVWGAGDRMVYTTGAERVLRTVPYSDIEVIDDCGHCPQVERPDRLAEMLLAFPAPYEALERAELEGGGG